MALLSGPPGLGKTTLAHVIAKHAGYNVVEINARLGTIIISEQIVAVNHGDGRFTVILLLHNLTWRC